MKRNSAFFFFSTALLFTSITAKADLVFYDDLDKSVFGFSMQIPADQTKPWIMISNCTAVGGVDAISQCDTATPLVIASEFKNAVMNTVLRWAKQHSHKALAPLSVDDLANLTESNDLRLNGQAAAIHTQIAELQKNVSKAKSLSEHVPDSSVYQKQYNDLNDQLNSLVAAAQDSDKAILVGAQAEATLETIADSLISLISKNNAQTGKINSLAHSLNKNTLADQVIYDLAIGAPIMEQFSFKTEEEGCLSAFEHAATIQGFNDRNALCKNLPSGTAACLFRFLQKDRTLSAARVETCKNGQF